MLNNGKFFFPPPKDGSDFKELFKRLAAAGAGRPLENDGFPAGPWTPELLAEAISEIDSNRIGVDLRTVQLWFQENEKGISPGNIRWLARIFGCDDPIAISEWQMELSAAQSRLTAKRREGRKETWAAVPGGLDEASTETLIGRAAISAAMAQDAISVRPKRSLSLAMRSEALFSSGSPLNLPAAVFAGVTALGFLSYVTGVHSVNIERTDRVTKQVGFLWAPNWTLLFMVFLPLLLTFAIELVVFWKTEGRMKLSAARDETEADSAWVRNVESPSLTYWAALSVCLIFAGVIQWTEVCLVPLMKGGGDYAIDWGKIAIIRPDITSVTEAVLLTGFAYLYMAICFYIFFAALILLYTIVGDFSNIMKGLDDRALANDQREITEARSRTIRGIFRCTVLGILMAICMKCQSSYLTSTSENIIAWLANDMMSALQGRSNQGVEIGYRMPTHFSSLLVVISTCVVFLIAYIRLGIDFGLRTTARKMALVVTLLVASYLSIGAFSGFSILLALSVFAALYGLLTPGFGQGRRMFWERK